MSDNKVVEELKELFEFIDGYPILPELPDGQHYTVELLQEEEDIVGFIDHKGFQQLTLK